MAESADRAVRDRQAKAPAATSRAKPATSDLAKMLNASPQVTQLRAIADQLAQARSGVAAPTPARHGTLSFGSVAGPAISPGAVLQGVFIKGAGVMNDEELAAAVTAHRHGAALTTAMRDVIQRRHRLPVRRYSLNNTITDLVSGAVAPPAPAAAGPTALSRRTAAGLVNLPHMHSNMLPIFRDAANTPPPVPAVRSEREHLESPSRHFRTYTPTHTQPPVLVQGHGHTVMGHGPEDAVDYWNRIGHTHSRSDNLAHNSSATIFHGLEEAHASAQSGGNTRSRYRSPSPTNGSHAAHWDRSHPDFNPRVPWHSYANAADANNGIRFVPQMTAAIMPQGGALATPVPVPGTGALPPVAPAPAMLAAPSVPSPMFGAPAPFQSAFSTPAFALHSSSLSAFAPLATPHVFTAASSPPGSGPPVPDSGTAMDTSDDG